MPRFEFDRMTKTYIQDAHKPWSGHIQGDYFVGAPEQLRIRELGFAEAYKPGRPLGVKPWPPYRRPWGIESSSPPYFDTGYDYPPEDYETDETLVRPPVGINELPRYFGVEGEYEPDIVRRPDAPVNLEEEIGPHPWKPDWAESFHAPVDEELNETLVSTEDELRPDAWSPDWLAHSADDGGFFGSIADAWGDFVRWLKYSLGMVPRPTGPDVEESDVVGPDEDVPDELGPDVGPGIDLSGSKKCELDVPADTLTVEGTPLRLEFFDSKSDAFARQRALADEGVDARVGTDPFPYNERRGKVMLDRCIRPAYVHIFWRVGDEPDLKALCCTRFKASDLPIQVSNVSIDRWYGSMSDAMARARKFVGGGRPAGVITASRVPGGEICITRTRLSEPDTTASAPRPVSGRKTAECPPCYPFKWAVFYPALTVSKSAPMDRETSRRNAILGIPRMVPRPDVPFWGQEVRYGVTKVRDTIIQDYPETDWPEEPEELAYMPCGVIEPYGLSVPTISKRKEPFPYDWPKR